MTGKSIIKQTGFTLIEVLMAMALFSLLITVVYAALGPAGEGFIQLQDRRDKLEKSHWLGRQLRLDMSYVSATNDGQLQPIRISHDARGDAVFDELWILSRESNQPSLTYIHYFLNEDTGKLMRESRMAWARDSVDSLQWEMGEAESFDVELLNDEGRWVQRWETAKTFKWPKAVRIKFRDAVGERAWDFPMFVGQAAL
jgi:prepilin-type N-terminal cleavage/methylation domain-containing protein